MNITSQLERLADDLEAAGHRLGAAEIRHELKVSREQLANLDRALNNHKVAISTLQLKEGATK